MPGIACVCGVSAPDVKFEEMTESRYRERPPAPPLAEYVDSVWYQEISPGQGLYGQRVVPDGCVDALWRDGLLCVAGPDTSWRIVQLPASSLVVSVRFRPGMAPLLFGDAPASEACNEQVDLAELWGPAPVRELGVRMDASGSPSEMADVLERAIVDRVRAVGEPDPIVAAAVREFDSPEPASVPLVAERFGLSERQFRRRFIAAVGYGPKSLESVLRLRRAMRLLEEQRLSIAEIAVAAGYADQPHMTREMRRLAGLTPALV
jgi:AraC-like DNA-binding protein